jgi:hypothetical protein
MGITNAPKYCWGTVECSLYSLYFWSRDVPDPKFLPNPDFWPWNTMDPDSEPDFPWNAVQVAESSLYGTCSRCCYCCSLLLVPETCFCKMAICWLNQKHNDVTVLHATGFLSQILRWRIAELDDSDAVQMNNMFNIFIFCIVPFLAHISQFLVGGGGLKFGSSGPTG